MVGCDIGKRHSTYHRAHNTARGGEGRGLGLVCKTVCDELNQTLVAVASNSSAPSIAEIGFLVTLRLSQIQRDDSFHSVG